MYQRRHRMRQHEKARLLEEQVASLSQEIAVLQQTVQATREDAQTAISTHGTLAGAPAQLVREYFRLFEHGYSKARAGSMEQRCYLRAALAANVCGPAVRGVDGVLDQWRLYSKFLLSFHVALRHLKAGNVDGTPTVVASITLSFRPRHSTLLWLFPGLNGFPRLADQLDEKVVTVDGTTCFLFGQDSRISWLGSELDFVGGLQLALGSLDAVVKCTDGAKLSLSTGWIDPRCESGQCDDATRASAVAIPQRGRQDLRYILCADEEKE